MVTASAAVVNVSYDKLKFRHVFFMDFFWLKERNFGSREQGSALNENKLRTANVKLDNSIKTMSALGIASVATLQRNEYSDHKTEIN